MGVSSLFHIAQSVCVKQAARITDVGDTPYHLIQPILKRLNAKQLALLEENSPIVTPHSDELWGFLIEKDFPDRPLNTGKLRLSPSSENAHMPKRALYRQYFSEKERFLATSADRLRKMTERLRKEKSKNSITKVQGVIADPTIRRRAPHNFSSRTFNSMKTKPKSILGKARRDVSHRSLMFGGPPKSYDPFLPFQSQNQMRTSPQKCTPLGLPNSQGVTSSKHAESSKSMMKNNSSNFIENATNSYSNAVRSERSSAGPESLISGNADSESSQNETTLIDSTNPKESSPTQPLRKRRPPPSIFLNTRKKQRIVPVNSVPKKAKHEEKQEFASDSAKPVKAIKSSVFY